MDRVYPNTVYFKHVMTYIYEKCNNISQILFKFCIKLLYMNLNYFSLYFQFLSPMSLFKNQNCHFLNISTDSNVWQYFVF